MKRQAYYYPSYLWWFYHAAWLFPSHTIALSLHSLAIFPRLLDRGGAGKPDERNRDLLAVIVLYENA